MNKCIACGGVDGALKAIQALVDKQSHDRNLWRSCRTEVQEDGLTYQRSLPKHEGKLQEALRELHAEIENWSQI